MKVFNHTAHKRLWGTIIKKLQEMNVKDYDFINADELKREALVDTFPELPEEEYPYLDCFACEYIKRNCNDCPLDWEQAGGVDYCTTLLDTGLYDKFDEACRYVNICEAIVYAIEIRECPVKKGVKCV